MTHVWYRQLAIRAGQELTLFDIGWKLFAHPVNSEDSLIGTFMGLFLFVASMFSFVMTVRPPVLLLLDQLLLSMLLIVLKLQYFTVFSPCLVSVACYIRTCVESCFLSMLSFQQRVRWPVCMQMTSVIGERETKVTQALQTMGMMRSAYWLSWITWEILLSFVIVLIAMAFGATCQINFFLKNAFGVVFFTLFTFQLAMVGFAYFVASFLRKTSTAISLGFTIFLIGFVFQVRCSFLLTACGCCYPSEPVNLWSTLNIVYFSRSKTTLPNRSNSYVYLLQYLLDLRYSDLPRSTTTLYSLSFHEITLRRLSQRTLRDGSHCLLKCKILWLPE